MSFASLLIRYAILGILISIAGLILYYGAVHDSAIMDELAHIPAGYGYVKYLDYRLNPEHPPLLKALAALPLLWLDLKFPLDNPSWQSDINGQWAAGAQFLYEYGNDAHKIISLARLAPIFITLLGAAFGKLVGIYSHIVCGILAIFSGARPLCYYRCWSSIWLFYRHLEFCGFAL
jgi:hypothetical protein